MNKLSEKYPPFLVLVNLTYKNRSYIGKRIYKDGIDQLRFCERSRFFGRGFATSKHFFDLSVPFNDPDVLWDFVEPKDLCSE